jgi:hypothetical protein
MRQLKSSYMGVAGLCSLCVILILAPACGCKSIAPHEQKRLQPETPFLPLLGLSLAF